MTSTTRERRHFPTPAARAAQNDVNAAMQAAAEQGDAYWAGLEAHELIRLCDAGNPRACAELDRRNKAVECACAAA